MVRWSDVSKHLQDFYLNNFNLSYYNHDRPNLYKAFIEIEQLWEDQFSRLNNIKYLMLSEAPLWGEKELYIYNVKTPPRGNFLPMSGIQKVTGNQIRKKEVLIDELGKLGLIVLDVSPFALDSPKKNGTSKTKISYNDLKSKEYSELIKPTLGDFLNTKLGRIKEKGENQVIFYRYKRVKDKLDSSVKEYLLENEFINSEDQYIPYLSKDGRNYRGAIDYSKFTSILKKGGFKTSKR